MRIEAYNAISQVYQTNKQTASNRNKNVKDTSDRIEFSETAKTYQTAKTHIKAMMAAGTYNVSAAKIADKLINNKSTLTF